jgi:hypothetical protein
MIAARVAIITLVCLATAVTPAADEISVQIDPKADFSAFRTFSMRGARIDSPRPELANSLFEKKLRSAIRAALVERGLKAVDKDPDLNVDFAILGQDFNTSVRGGMRGMGPQPYRYTAGMLTIDMFRAGEDKPVFHGVYLDDEETGSKLVVRLPEDAKKLIDRYPRRK